MCAAERRHQRLLRAVATARIVFEAVAECLLVRIDLAVLPVSRLLGADLPLGSAPLPPGAESAAERLRRLVNRCLGRPPLRSSCLVRALVLCRMLRRRGLPCQLVISVRTQAGRLAAHAEARLPAPDEAASSLSLEIRG
jgi:Transglutaminase-like superfamily